MPQASKSLLAIFAMATLGACATAPAAPSKTPTAAAPATSEAATTGESPTASGSSAGSEAQTSMMGDMPAGMNAGMCPMRVEGTTVVASDVEGGVALSFTTPTGDVSELRNRVRRMAEMHDHKAEMHARPGGMMRGGPGGGAGGGAGRMRGGCMMGGGMMGGGMMPAATASVEDVEGGARLTLRPRDPGSLDALRKHASECTERMRSGECPMMGASGTTAPEAPPAPDR